MFRFHCILSLWKHELALIQTEAEVRAPFSMLLEHVLLLHSFHLQGFLSLWSSWSISLIFNWERCMHVCYLCVCVCLYVLRTFHLPEIMILPHEHNPHFSECQINWGRLSCPKNSIQNRSPGLHLLKKKVILEQSWGLGFSAWVLRIEQHCHQMLMIVTEAVYLQSCSCRLSISLECASPIVQLFESCHLLPGMQQGLGFCRTEFLLYQQTGTFFMIYVHTFELSVCVLGFMAIAWLKRSCKWCGKPRESVTLK